MISFPLKTGHGEKEEGLITLGVECHKIFFRTQPYNQALLEKIRDFIDNIVANINAEYRARSLEDELIHSEFFRPEDNKVCYLLEKEGVVINPEKFWNFLFKIIQLEKPHQLKLFANISEARDISFAYDEQIKIEQELLARSKAKSSSKFSLFNWLNSSSSSHEETKGKQRFRQS